MKTHVENIIDIMDNFEDDLYINCKKRRDAYLLAVKSELEFLKGWEHVEENSFEKNDFILQSFKLRIADCEEAIKEGEEND